MSKWSCVLTANVYAINRTLAHNIIFNVDARRIRSMNYRTSMKIIMVTIILRHWRFKSNIMMIFKNILWFIFGVLQED